jgi:hypothetical protein
MDFRAIREKRSRRERVMDRDESVKLETEEDLEDVDQDAGIAGRYHAKFPFAHTVPTAGLPTMLKSGSKVLKVKA